MRPQLSQDYKVDARYTGGKNSVDNTAGEAFLNRFLERKRDAARPDLSADQQTEDRFIVRGPGNAGYSFRNGFRASR
jgi:hypothetical protein